jgi:hypothetical protein
LKSYRFDQIFNYVIKIDFFWKNFQKKSTNSEENMTSILSTQRQSKINAHVSNLEKKLNMNTKMFGNILATINLIDNITKTINRVEEKLEKLNGSINRVEEISENIKKTINRVEEISENITKTINRMDEKFQNTNEIRSEENNKPSNVINIEDFEEFPGDEVEEVNIPVNSNYKCNICCNEYPNESKFKIHMKRCRLEKKFECDVEGCDWKFKTSNELRSHLDSHSIEKKYSCDLCECKYKQKSGLSTHKQLKHKGQSESISDSIPSQNQNHAISIQSSITFSVRENSGNSSPIHQTHVV